MNSLRNAWRRVRHIRRPWLQSWGRQIDDSHRPVVYKSVTTLSYISGRQQKERQVCFRGRNSNGGGAQQGTWYYLQVGGGDVSDRQGEIVKAVSTVILASSVIVTFFFFYHSALYVNLFVPFTVTHSHLEHNHITRRDIYHFHVSPGLPVSSVTFQNFPSRFPPLSPFSSLLCVPHLRHHTCGLFTHTIYRKRENVLLYRRLSPPCISDLIHPPPLRPLPPPHTLFLRLSCEIFKRTKTEEYFVFPFETRFGFPCLVEVMKRRWVARLPDAPWEGDQAVIVGGEKWQWTHRGDYLHLYFFSYF